MRASALAIGKTKQKPPRRARGSAAAADIHE
jgi:hypothetical protein